MAESSGNLNYHGLIAQVTKRFSTGFQTSANYTYSKASDDAPEDVPAFGNLRQTNPVNRYLDRGASDGDVRHVFRMSLVAAPNLAFSSQAARAILNGYQIGAIVFADSGERFNISAGFDLNRDGIDGDRPVGLSRNAGRIPAFFGVDARLTRRFRLSEQKGVEIYGEASNLFNKKSVSSFANTTLPASNVNTSLVNPLTGELRGPLPDFRSGLTTWRPARSVQLGIKFDF
jgi:hypothetical protein